MKKYLTSLVTLFLVSSLHAQQDLIQYVNPLQGSGSTPEMHHGGSALLVGYPHGVNLWRPAGAGFGSGWFRGGLSFMPLSDSLKVKNEGKAKIITAKPHYYKATFDNGLITEMTATERCGYFKLSYPKNKKAFLVINEGSEVNIDSEKRTITGNGPNYFIIQFDQPFLSNGKMNDQPEAGGRNGTETGGRSRIAAGGKNGVYVEFKKGAVVQLKVATSGISLEQAQTTFDREIKPYSFNEVKDAAYKVWNDLLNKIVVEGGTLEEKKTFYSCLFRANLQPSKEYEVDKEGKPHYFYNGKVYDGYYYSNPILWDNFRTLFPLQNIINTEGQKEYVQSLLAFKLLSGWWEWRANGPIMLGNHAISVFADAWAKGVRTFNPDTVLKYYYQEVTHSEQASNNYNLEHGRGYGRMGYANYFAEGYIPYPKNSTKVSESTARTLEYAYDDFCAYQLAKTTGNSFYENIFKRPMYNYRNVFDTTDDFMKGRDIEGEWQKNFNPYEWGGPFVEGNAWQWKWFVPQDPQGLINLAGGKQSFASQLDELFTVPADSVLNGGYNERIHEINESVAAGMGQYGGANEPGFNIIYLYDYCGQPWKCQKLIRTNMAKLFNSGPEGFLGDEDGGAVSSWYVFSAMGFYPVTPGATQYAIGSPVFNEATITLENGKKLTIVANNNSADNVYIQSATLNGKPYDHNWITHEDVMKGGELKFTMSNQPNIQRGISEEDKPYSISRQK